MTQSCERSDSYREFFRQELAAVSEQRGSWPRLRWLAEHLEEYVERWLGFCAIASESSSSLATAPGFNVIDLGAQALEDEIAFAQLPAGAQAAWQSFLSSLHQVRDRGGREEAEQLGIAARTVRSAIASAP